MEIEYYVAIKARIAAGEIGIEEAIQLAVEQHIESTVAWFPCLLPRAGDDPYCYPGTDVLLNKLGIRNRQALEIAETEIGTLRDAQLILFGLPA